MKKEKPSKVGIISVGVPWFDLSVAQINLEETRSWLSQSWHVVGPQQVVIDKPALENAIQDFQTVNRPQVLIIQIGTFPDGEVPLHIAERLRVPIIIHSLPEPEIDKRIAINSLCGANLTTFTLTEMGFAHKAIHGFVSDPEVQKQMAAYVRAGLVLENVKQERIGLIGFRAPGFYPCVFDELLRKVNENRHLSAHFRPSKVVNYRLHRWNQSKNITLPWEKCWKTVISISLRSKIGQRLWDWMIPVASGQVWAGY